MKIFFPILIIILFLSSCSEEEKQLTLFSPEAFAFSMGDSWELNSSIQIKGFQLREKDEKFYADLSYIVHIITPEADTLYDADYGLLHPTSSEEMSDVGLDIQIEFDSSFSAGEYKIIYEVKDEFSEQTAIAETPFRLTSD